MGTECEAETALDAAKQGVSRPILRLCRSQGTPSGAGRRSGSTTTTFGTSDWPTCVGLWATLVRTASCSTGPSPRTSVRPLRCERRGRPGGRTRRQRDITTEYRIQQSLDRLTVAIAHRLSTVRDADTILVLEDGHIAERGDHDELLAARGFYATLWRAQAGDVDALPEAVAGDGRDI